MFDKPTCKFLVIIPKLLKNKFYNDIMLALIKTKIKDKVVTKQPTES